MTIHSQFTEYTYSRSSYPRLEGLQVPKKLKSNAAELTELVMAQHNAQNCSARLL